MGDDMSKADQGRARRSATRLLCSASLTALAVLGLPSAAHAQDQDRYWDANGTGTGSGGNGNWNTADPVWSESNSDVLGPYRIWDNGALDNAIFGVTAGGTTTTVGTVTLTEPITVHNMTFQRVHGWVLSGGTLTLAGTAPTINTLANTTINSVIAGTNGLTKTGSSQLFLTGANTFSGGITLSGSLRAANDAALGNAGNNITTIANASFTLDTGSTARTITIGGGTILAISGAGAGSALYTGAGSISVVSGVTLSNDGNTYTGTTRLNGVNQGSGIVNFTSVRNLGEASSLGAPTTVADGTITFAGGSQYSDNIAYVGDGDTSNRNWVLQGGPPRVFRQRGTGTLTLTGDISVTPTSFLAETADFELLGVISGSGNVGFGASAAGSITLGGANIFTGNAGVSGGIVRAPVLADGGLASSLGAASTVSLGHLGKLSYTGAGASSNRTWSSDGATSVLNDGTGALTLTGDLAFNPAGSADTLTLGGDFGGTSNLAGIISGTGNLASSGNGTWILGGANTRTGTLSVNGGTLRAGSASAFGTITGVTVNAGTLDLGGFDLTTPTLAGTGGTLALGNAFLTLNTATANTFTGTITGTGGLNKRGTGTLTLTGASTYSGDTNIEGGTLALNFAPAGGPSSDIVNASSTLNMSGGTLNITGAAGEANTQTFDGLNITTGANTVTGISGSGGSLGINFGAINRTGGIINFNLPTSGNFTTSNTSLGGWATVNGTDYAKVVGGNILAFTDADYTDKDDASTWASGEFISDSDGDADSYFGTVGNSIQLGGLQFTTPDATTTVTIANGQTLGVDGAIIVAPSVLANNQTISGGNLTGLSGAGGVLGVLQNGTGTLAIASTIIDNGGATGFTKGGQGTVSLTGANSYTGATTLSNGRLVVNSIGSGGAVSAIGASGAASSNLVLQGGILQYTGGSSITDRGFTLVNGGADTPTIQVDGAANLTFTGQVTSPDDEGLLKTGTGTLSLDNAANDYVGVTTVSGGTLSTNALANGGLASGIGQASSASSNIVLQSGGRLQYNGGTTSTNRGFTVGTGGGRIGVAPGATTLTIGGIAAGAGGLTKDGDGTLILAGVNTYTGGTRVTAGTLRAGSTTAFGGTNQLMTVDAGATLDLASLNNSVGALNGGGQVTLGSATLTANGNTGSFSGTLSGTGGFTKIGGGSQTFVGCNNSYTGTTTIQGLLIVDCLANGGVASGIGASSSASSSLVFGASMLRYTGGTVTTDRGFTLQSTGQIDVNNAATTLTFTGTITGAGQLQKYGAGTLVLGGDNNNTGGVNVQAGILRAGSATAFGTGSYVLANVAGAVLDLNGFDMSASALGGGGAAGGNIQLGSATLTVGGANGNYAGLITGAGGLVKTAGGTQYLSGCDSNYVGGTSVTGGILQVQCLTNGGINSSIGASSNAASNLVVNNGALTYLGAGSSTDRLMTIGGTAYILSSGTGAVDFTNTGALVFANPNTAQTIRLGGTYLGDNRFGLRLDNNGAGVTSFIKQDAGTWILTNSGSTYTGTTQILGGVLGVDKLSNGGEGSSIGASSNAATNLIIGSGATLRYTGTGDTTDRRFTLAVGTTFIESSGTGAVNFTNNGAVSYTGNGARVMALGGTNAGDSIMGATIGNQNAANITSLAKNDSGRWILTGTNTYTGLTNVNAGTLIIGNGGTTGSIVSSTINNAGVLGFNRSDMLTITGDIQGSGAVQQLGTGTTILTGASTYTGGTTIAQGTLQLGNGGPTGSIVGDVVNNGSLTFNRNNGYSFGGTISGTGAVRQIGSGTTILTGANSYLGGTGITAGTLQVSSDANLGAASGGLSFNGGTLNTTASFTSGRATNLAGAGTFSTDAGTTLTMTGAVSGPGALTKAGAGALVVTANNSYAGGTTISAGTLQIGNGGATGSITGNVLNNGALVVNRSGTLTLGGTILGGGSFTQAGPGTTVLTGNNTYAGPTAVNSGTLLVNGNQSGATNLTSVASGAALGGTGIIGGSVTIADGGTLAAGSGGVGALTINGNLALGNASQLNFEFGQPNLTGGPLNDLVNVGGNLTLDGVVNVSQTPGGSFGPGVYRMFNYSGALTDNGLTVGTMPPGSDVFVQTAIAGQVNLANTAGLTLNFWDGAGQPKNDGTIQGGDGTWRVGGGENNWTEVNGAINADYAQDSFAIFQGASGTVTVDNGGGNVQSTGMQFATGGYTIAGGPLTLTGTDALIRTGDGSPADAGITATITADLTGSARLVKDLAGTLVLAGTNSYTGGTAVNGGTLGISADANLGDAAGGLSLNGGTVNTTASFGSNRTVDLAGAGTFLTDGGTVLTLGGQVSGAGALTKDGAGSFVLTADNAYAGGTMIAAGTLQLGNGGTSGAISGDVANDGLLAFNRSDSLTFGGAISGSGAVSQIGTGTTILTGDSNYTGGTTISAGLLQLGAGGATGAITGDVLNNAALVFNRSNEYSFAGLISGTGDVRQEGAGTTILTADNSYTGSTVISSGTLLINGNQAAANGATNVLGGGALGGTGTIGGDVFVGGGATLTPGDAAGPGTLTVNGNLGFSPNAVLAYDFGQSNNVGGPLNDLVNVGGDLTLDGTLNVTTSSGGSFDPGIYRVINYAGALTNNGLTIGSIPSGTDFYVQTSVAGQVNLINTNGLALRFWDGAAGGRNDGLITGGDGVWENVSGNDNWTLDDASINAPFLDSAFAIFGGAAGTVSVDNGLGAVRASGMQFASDGYTITGQDLTLVGPESVIRVGDGTAAGLGHTATIDARIFGDTQLVKADLGMLVLTSANSYTGGTRIDAGTLRISGDIQLGDAAGALSLNGGTLATTAAMASGRSVNLLGTGTLLTDAGTSLTLFGPVSGAGGFTKAGTGILMLTGNNSFGGDVDVTAGQMFVNGDQSAATGATRVASGATLSGSGIIGGNVTLADGATLAPGGTLFGVGTLTVGGNLALNSGSALDFQFGAANVAGGGFNDLVNVGGDLTLDGTINVSVPGGGSFGPGIYRVFNYGGALTDNGLTLGTMPGGSAVSVQTAIAGQVNLVNTAGLTLSFWDGAAGPKNDGTVNGGDGIWRVGGGTNNWTSASGTPNADYAQDSFAIFSAAPGTVAIDDVGGNVLASGMQFANDGYRITGDALTLTGTGAIVQVGDGSAASSGYTATIDAALAGAAGLVKTDAGMLVLTGANIYTGGTAINGGTLRVSSDANLGDAAGGLSLDGGALNTTATFTSARAVDLAGAGTFLTDDGTSLTLGGVVSGAAALTKDGAGSLVLTNANTYAGGTAISAGTLQLGNGGAAGSITGDVANNGTLAFNRSDSLTFVGAITGAGAVNQIGTGTTILTASNNYSGGTTISAGTLQLGDGGTSGGITGDVVNNAALVFNRSDAVTYAGLISGTGRVEQAGAGTTILTGANSYTGATAVSTGTLLVNGDQSAAIGTTNVAAGATLGGTGIIGGDVSVADGATLAPGAGGAGTLTINGNLSLAAGTTLAWDFGLANAPGSPLNDVVNVGGDLMLDGTIDVAVTPGGAFDIGLYRVINYGGALTDNGLAIGTMPAGSDVFVQTSVANQVNLVNTGGVTLNFWDGAAGPKFDGAVNGGDGVWQNGTGNDNWTDASGAVNAPFDDGAFAIFTGAPGTVTIDNGLGAVTASGLQFAVDGYSLAGGDLTLTGPQSVIRVGDGTAGGGGYTATIASAITGATQLVKTDAGTLVLTSANSYTGGTAINGGTVRIASDANLGAAAGGLTLNGGTLNTTADLSSARAVDLAGTGAFVTDGGTTLTLTGTVSGAGGLTKSGAGALVLSGTGSHAGTTSVAAGTLLVNGNFAGATGFTSVASGANLGGTGTIGGDVTLASGATLTPGAGGAGTLAIGGDLSLGAGTTLAWEFGAANVAGGALNDLVNVGGDLTLDGTIDVTVPTGGAFDVGVYRVFNYGGTLTDNGLGLGTMPAGSDVAVQTSISGQVNLVNSAGLTLNFWDGAAGPKNNGVINGGDGIWQNSTGNDNWTDAAGAVNAAYTDGAFAVFGGTGGSVTVDNGLGQVSAAGMQFAANGYAIAGAGIALTGPQSTIRVGDGSTAGAGLTATINAALSGGTELVKTDAGTLVLGGANSYTGGTRINGGTVQIASDANLGAASGAVTLDHGTLATSANVTSARNVVMSGTGTFATADGTTFTLGGLFSGTGALTKAGAGTLLVTGDSSGFAGTTAVSAGTLAVTGKLGGALTVDGGARLEGTGQVGNLTNSGTVAPGRDGFGALTVNGSYTGSGGTLEIEAALGGDASQTDRLVVTNGTSGATAISVTNRGGLGAQTVEGIKIIDVTGGTSAGTFTLSGDYNFEGSSAVIAGAFGYRLFQGGVATPNDGDWYLRSALLDPPNLPQGPLYQPGVPLYESYAATLQTLNRLPTLQQRVGNRQWSGFTQGGVGMWGRIESTRHRPDAAFSTSGTDLDVDNWSLQAGFDKALVDNAEDTIIAGINGRYGTADARVRSRFGDGSIDTSGYGLGATLTWYESTGFYADAQAQVSWYRSDLESDMIGKLADNNHGSGETFSLEVGKRAPVSGGLSVTPQIQMIYSHVRFDSFIDPNDARVSSDRTGSLKTRWGISLDHQKSWDGSGGTRRSHLYGIVNLSHEWLDGSIVGVSGTPLARRDERLWGEVGLGGSYSWNNDRFTLFTEISADTAIDDFGDSNSLRGNAGFRMRF